MFPATWSFSANSLYFSANIFVSSASSCFFLARSPTASNAICPNRFASSCCSSTFFLSKIFPSSFSAFWVSLLSPLRSWFGLLLISIVPSAIADFVVDSASPLAGVPIFGVIPFSFSFAFSSVFILTPILLALYSALFSIFE